MNLTISLESGVTFYERNTSLKNSSSVVGNKLLTIRITLFSKNRIYALPSVFSGNFFNSSKSTVEEFITGFSLKPETNFSSPFFYIYIRLDAE